MHHKTQNILGINPGTKYLGIAVFQGPNLRVWKIRVTKGRWSKDKKKRIKGIIHEYIDHYDLNTLAIKKLHPSRSSANLDTLVAEIKDYCRRKGLGIYSYSIEELEANFSNEGRINRIGLAEIIAQTYPVLFHEIEKERINKNPYYHRLFEAVALGSLCYDLNEK